MRNLLCYMREHKYQRGRISLSTLRNEDRILFAIVTLFRAFASLLFAELLSLR